MRYGIHYDTTDHCDVFEGRETEEDTKAYIQELIQDYINDGTSEGYVLDNEETCIDETGAYLMFVKGNDFYYIYLSMVTDDGEGWMDIDGDLI